MGEPNLHADAAIVAVFRHALSETEKNHRARDCQLADFRLVR